MVNVDTITFSNNELPTETQYLLDEAEMVFMNRVSALSKKKISVKKDDSAYDVKLFLEIHDPSVVYFTTDTDESYQLHVGLATDGSNTVSLVEIYRPRSLADSVCYSS